MVLLAGLLAVAAACERYNAIEGLTNVRVKVMDDGSEVEVSNCRL